METILKLLISTMAFMLLPCSAEFTVVMPDSSSALVDAPQNKFSSSAHTDPAEQKAVYEIMSATGNGWASSIPDVCRGGRWHGIECMPDGNNVFHVVSLSFGALSDDTAFPPCDQSSAYLSPALTRLPHIRSLFFYRCFTGNPLPIPAFLGKLGSSLRSLVLRENGHVGKLPGELGNLTSLKVLDLHGNNIGYSIQDSIGRLSKLQLLDLSNNKLTGVIPELNLPSLHVLDLNHNLLQGQIPVTLGNCRSLIKIDLNKNRLTGQIPESLTRIEGLTLLDLSHNYLSGPLPISFKRLTSLQALILKGNPTKASITEDMFVGMKNLIALVLSDMELEGHIPESIAKLRNLRVLHLDGNRLTGSIPSSFTNVETLRELRLDNNLLTGPVPFGKEMLWRMGRKLRVSNNSGLCFEADSVRKIDGGDAVSGIGYCNEGEAMEMAKNQDMNHLSVIDNDSSNNELETEPLQKQSSASEQRQQHGLELFVLLTVFFYFVNY